MRALIFSGTLFAIFYGIMYLTDAPNWACIQTGILAALIIELMVMVKK